MSCLSLVCWLPSGNTENQVARTYVQILDVQLKLIRIILYLTFEIRVKLQKKKKNCSVHFHQKTIFVVLGLTYF